MAVPLTQAAQKFASTPRDNDNPNRIDYLELPYGVATTPECIEIAFNRKRNALCKRLPGGSCEELERCHFSKFLGADKTCNQEYFIESDCKNPKKAPRYWTRSEKILFDFFAGRSIRKYIICITP